MTWKEKIYQAESHICPCFLRRAILSPIKWRGQIRITRPVARYEFVLLKRRGGELLGSRCCALPIAHLHQSVLVHTGQCFGTILSAPSLLGEAIAVVETLITLLWCAFSVTALVTTLFQSSFYVISDSLFGRENRKGWRFLPIKTLLSTS